MGIRIAYLFAVKTDHVELDVTQYECVGGWQGFALQHGDRIVQIEVDDMSEFLRTGWASTFNVLYKKESDWGWYTAWGDFNKTLSDAALRNGITRKVTVDSDGKAQDVVATFVAGRES